MSKKEPGTIVALTEPAQQIWLAGLGAFALAGDEGAKLFTALVKKGRAVEKANLARLDDLMGAVADRVEDIRAIPTTTVEKISDGFDTGVATVLHKLGVPTKKEIGTLTRRVEELTRTLEKKPARVRAPRARRAAAAPKAVATV
jgi:poly(hydroxyalkanoate) granule-associated protein